MQRFCTSEKYPKLIWDVKMSCGNFINYESSKIYRETLKNKLFPGKDFKAYFSWGRLNVYEASLIAS